MRQLRMMRALGPGSVSSFLKIILDVIYVGLWIFVSLLSIFTLIALLFSFNPDLLARLVLPDLLAACSNAPGDEARDGCAALRGWDRTNTLDARGAHVHLHVADLAELGHA